MTTEDIRTTTTERDGFTILTIEGSVIRQNSDVFRKTLETIADGETNGIAVDFAAVDYMDSSGLGACAALSKRLSREGERPFVIFGASRTIGKMWRLVGLDLAVPIVTDADAAVALMKGSDS